MLQFDQLNVELSPQLREYLRHRSAKEGSSSAERPIREDDLHRPVHVQPQERGWRPDNPKSVCLHVNASESHDGKQDELGQRHASVR